MRLRTGNHIWRFDDVREKPCARKARKVIGVTNSRVVKVKEIYEQNTRGIFSSGVYILCNIFNTWASRSIHGLGKWYAKFRTGKFRSGIAFTICTNQFNLPKNDREGLNPVSKMALKKWITDFRLDIPSGKTEQLFQMFRCSRKFSDGTTQKV